MLIPRWVRFVHFLLKVLNGTKTHVWMRWAQALAADELVDDGHGGNGWIFTVPLCISFSSPTARLAFPLTPPVTCMWFLLPTFSLFCFLFCSLLPWTGHSPNKAKQRMIIHKNVVEYIGRLDTEKVRHPAEMSSPPKAGFPSAFVSVAGFNVQWVHILFHRALPPCQEKCLVVNKHQTRACKCWLPPGRF